MNTRLRRAGTGLLLLLGCGTEPIEVQLDQLVGTWQATSVEYLRQDDSQQRVDVLELGPEWLWTLTIHPDDTHAVELCNPLGCDQVTGTVALVGDTLVLSDDTGFEDYARAYTSLDGSLLHLRWMETVTCGEFGWEGPPCPIPTVIEVTARLE